MIALNSRYIRNTNVTRYHDQGRQYDGHATGSCYAHAATYAYLNTIARIYGSRPAPSFAECFPIADYNKGRGGYPTKSLRRLEEHFGYGVLCKELESFNYPSIRDIITISVIVSFTTSKAGWHAIAQGSLLEWPGGISDGWHATLVEGYDFEKNCAICKNSWGDRTAEPRFDLRFSALHDFKCIRVFFTIASISGKTTSEFHPELETFDGELDGQSIEVASMTEETAIYSTEYVCERLPSNDHYNYVGYDVDQWIAIKSRGEETITIHVRYWSNSSNCSFDVRMPPNEKFGYLRRAIAGRMRRDPIWLSRLWALISDDSRLISSDNLRDGSEYAIILL
jgi:hypothetical protein